MADEAVLRLVLQDGGGDAGGAAPAAGATAAPRVPVAPAAPAAPRAAALTVPPAPRVVGGGGGGLEPPRAAEEAQDFIGAILGVLKKMRGVLGGFLGPLAGAALDVLATFDKLSVAAKAFKPSPGAAEPFTSVLPPDVTGAGLPEVLPEVLPADVPDPGPMGPPKPLRRTQLAPPGTGKATKLGTPPGMLGEEPEVPAYTPQLELDPGEQAEKPTGAPALPGQGPPPVNEAVAVSTPGGLPQKPSGATAGVAPGALDVSKAASPMMGLGMAAGAVGAAVAAVEAFKAVVTGAAQALGSFVVAVVSPSDDPGQYLAALGQQVTKASQAFGILGGPMYVFGGAIGAAIEAVAGFMQAMDGMVERFAQYSPQLAAAQVRGEVAQQIGDIRRAQEATPALLDYLDQRQEMQAKFEDAKMRMLTKMMPVAIKLMEIAVRMMPLVEIVVDLLAQLADPLGIIKDDVARMRRDNEDDDLGTDLVMRGFLDPLFMGPQQPGVLTD